MDQHIRSPRRRPPWAGLMAVALLLALPSFAAAPAAPPRSALDGVKELEKPVSYSETKIPLGELVQRVAADTGAPLTAAPGVADEPVAVVVKDLPARELLEQLAELLDYQWHRRSSAARGASSAPEKDEPASAAAGYEIRTTHSASASIFEIWQDLAAKQREEALRGARLAAIEKGLRDQIDACAELSRLSDKEIQQVLEDDQKRISELSGLPPEQQQKRLSSPEEQRRSARARVAQELKTPLPRALAGLLASLTPPQWEHLRGQGSLTFSSNPGPGELPLPAEAERRLGAAPLAFPPLDAQTSGRPDIVELHRAQEEALGSHWMHAAGYRAVFSLSSDPLRTQDRLSLDATAVPLLTDVTSPAPTPPLGFDLLIMADIHFRLDSDALGAVPPEPDDAAQLRREWKKDPVFGTAKPFRPETQPRKDLFGPFGEPVWRVRDLLPDLARIYNVQLIADAYGSGPAFPRSQFSFTEPRPLWQLLQMYVGPVYRWDRRGRLVRLRSRTWYLERPREIPLRLVRRWKAQFDRSASLPFEEYLRMPADLTELQWMNLGSLSQEPDLAGMAGDLGETRWGRQELRLFASLSPQQRQQMLQGRSIPLAQLTAAQRELCLAALEELNRRSFPPLDLREAAGWSFGLTRRPMLRIQEPPGSFPAFREEPLPATGAPAPFPGAPSGPPPAASQALRYSIWRVGLCFQTGAGSRGVSSLAVAPAR